MITSLKSIVYLSISLKSIVYHYLFIYLFIYLFTKSDIMSVIKHNITSYFTHTFVFISDRLIRLTIFEHI